MTSEGVASLPPVSDKLCPFIHQNSPVYVNRYMQNDVILMSARLCYTLSSEWPCVLSAKYVNDRIPMKSVQLQICGYPEGDCSVAAVGFLEFPH